MKLETIYKTYFQIILQITVIVLFITSHFTQTFHYVNNIEIAIWFGTDYKTYFMNFLTDITVAIGVILQIIVIILEFDKERIKNDNKKNM
jgi:hypothetical protein